MFEIVASLVLCFTFSIFNSRKARLELYTFDPEGTPEETLKAKNNVAALLFYRAFKTNDKLIDREAIIEQTINNSKDIAKNDKQEKKEAFVNYFEEMDKMDKIPNIRIYVGNHHF